MSVHTETTMSSTRPDRAPEPNVSALRWMAGVLMGVLLIALTISFSSYFNGGPWHLLIASAGTTIAMVGMLVILLRLRPETPPSQARSMAYLLLALIILELLAHILIFEGMGLYLIGGGLFALTIIGLVVLPRNWGVYATVGFVFLATAGLLEWLEPLPRDDLSLDPTAGFATPLVYLLLLIALGFFAFRSARVGSIRSRLLISFVLIALLPGVLSAGVSVALGLQSSERTILAQLEAAADAREAGVLAWIEALQLDVEVLRELEYADLRTLLTAEPDSPPFQAAYSLQQRRFQDSLALRNNFDVLFLLDHTGALVLSSHPLDEVWRTAGSEVVSDVLVGASGGPYVGPLLSSAWLDRPGITVALPILDANGETLGVLAGQAGLAQVTSIMGDRTGLGDRQEIYLINAEGSVLATAPRSDGATSPYQPDVVRSQGVDALLVTRARQSGRYLNHLGEAALGEYRWVSGPEIGLVIEAQSYELVQTTLANIGVYVALTALSVGFAIMGSVFIANGIARPLAHVAEVATVVAEGDLTRLLPVERNDEVGRMAVAFNRMTRRLRDLVGSLEERVAQRTVDLERRSAQLQTAADVARLAASIREIDELLRVAAAQIGEQFGFYHVGIFLSDEAHRTLVMRAASSGAALLERGFRLELAPSPDRANKGRTGIIVDVAQTGQPSIVADVSQDARYLAIPELPNTRSEICLPLRVRGEVIGVLDVQSTEYGGFTESDTPYLQTLADQLSLAIENARLLSEAEQRLNEIGRLVQVQRQEGWREMLAEGTAWSYAYDGVEARAGKPGQLVAQADLELPVESASGAEGDRLGTVRVKLGPEREVTQADAELARAVVAEAAQALERASLFSGTQRALLEADTLYRCGRAIVEARNVDEVVSALANYVVAPGIDRMIVLLSRPGPLGRPPVLEVASVWRGGPGGMGQRSASTLRRGERWEMSSLPALVPPGDGGPALGGRLVIEDALVSPLLDAASRQTLLHTIGVRAALVLPLRSGSVVLGWLLIGATEAPYAFTPQEVRMYQGIADQAAPVLRSFELLDLATRRAERERSISVIGDSIRRFTDIETILRTSVLELGRALCASEGVIRLHPGGSARTEGPLEPEADLLVSGNGAEPSDAEPKAATEERDV